MRKARNNIPPHQLLSRVDISILRHLHLQLTPSEVQIHDLFHAGGIGRRYGGFMLGDLVAASDTQVNATFAYESGDVGSGEKDQGDGEVLDEGNVQATVAVELDVGAGEEVEACFV